MHSTLQERKHNTLAKCAGYASSPAAESFLSFSDANEEEGGSVAQGGAAESRCPLSGADGSRSEAQSAVPDLLQSQLHSALSRLRIFMDINLALVPEQLQVRLYLQWVKCLRIITPMWKTCSTPAGKVMTGFSQLSCSAIQAARIHTTHLSTVVPRCQDAVALLFDFAIGPEHIYVRSGY